MSARASDTAANPSHGGPLFPVADWGYDRLRVELRVDELVRQLGEARRRGDQAEHAVSQLQPAIQPPQGHGPQGGAGFAVDAAQVREQAGVLAAGVLAAAGRRIETMIVAGRGEGRRPAHGSRPAGQPPRAAGSAAAGRGRAGAGRHPGGGHPHRRAAAGSSGPRGQSAHRQSAAGCRAGLARRRPPAPAARS
jgi:hypothetical protein